MYELFPIYVCRPTSSSADRPTKTTYEYEKAPLKKQSINEADTL
jgi:hypothetical protein